MSIVVNFGKNPAISFVGTQALNIEPQFFLLGGAGTQGVEGAPSAKRARANQPTADDVAFYMPPEDPNFEEEQAQ